MLLGRAVDDDPRCRDCGGVCCRSFPTVELTAPEFERLQALGARRLELSLVHRHKLVIENGCEFLVDGRCSIYEDRPDVCRRFICENGAGQTGDPGPGPTRAWPIPPWRSRGGSRR